MSDYHKITMKFTLHQYLIPGTVKNAINCFSSNLVISLDSFLLSVNSKSAGWFYKHSKVGSKYHIGHQLSDEY